MLVDLLAGVGRQVCLSVMQLSQYNIMQHCRYYSFHQLGKVGKDVGNSHTKDIGTVDAFLC